jgi:phage terminase large subunit
MSKKKTVISKAEGSALDLGEGNPKQNQFYASRTLFTAYGGAKGGGKTHAIRTKAVGGALRWPGIRILIIRRTYPELQQNHIEPILKTVPRSLAGYNSSLHTLYFTNGSIIKFGHYQSATAEQEYQGQEYDWIFMDEATQFSEREFRYLGACLRGVRDIPKRFYITCNPGGIGHRWVKRLFIDREYRTSGSSPEDNENPADYNFIFATVEDNKYLLKSSPAYLSMLSSLPESIRRAYRYGDWNALSGSYFSEFSEDNHVVRPFPVPEGWVRYRSIDYGLDMLACLWVAIDPAGRSYVYRELKLPGLIVSEAARMILASTLPDERIVATFAPPDIWSRQKDTGRSMAELFTLGGVPVLRCDSGRVQGHMMVKELLMIRPDGLPGLMIFGTCRELIGDLQAIQADETNPNDCAVQPHDITHTVDALRYFCVSRTGPTMTEVPAAEERDCIDYDSFMTGGVFQAGYIGF